MNDLLDDPIQLYNKFRQKDELVRALREPEEAFLGSRLGKNNPHKLQASTI